MRLDKGVVGCRSAVEAAVTDVVMMFASAAPFVLADSAVVVAGSEEVGSGAAAAAAGWQLRTLIAGVALEAAEAKFMRLASLAGVCVESSSEGGVVFVASGGAAAMSGDVAAPEQPMLAARDRTACHPAQQMSFKKH